VKSATSATGDSGGAMQSAQVNASPSIAQHQAAMADYQREGVALGKEIANRGPARFDDAGRLAPDILEAFKEQGFYIFEGIVSDGEVDALRAEIDTLLDRAPVGRDETVDRAGRPAFGTDFARLPYTFIKPLSDPWGGTELLGGRHPTQMSQPQPDVTAPDQVVYLMHGMCQSMKSGLRLYGHPQLLAIAEAINGADFTPFNDAIFVKQPGLGGSVAWHQDGVTHWESPDWNPGIHGFNFQVQLYPSTPGNCLWVIPGSHKRGRADIKAMVADNGGSERLPGAVPLTCNAGDATIVNRQMLHCSFANTSPDLRVSMTFGFHRYTSVLGARAGLGQEKQRVIYDAERIFRRSSVIQVAIDARRQAYPAETPYRYQPFVDRVDDFRFTPETFESVITDYYLSDLSI
jgi:hypothetical protein